jgi:hypothetical protein
MSSFCSDFLANFLSDLLIGVIVGGIVVAWWIGTRLNERERQQQRRDEVIAALGKTAHYLGLLGAEIEEQLTVLPKLRSAFSEFGWGRIIRIDTPHWDLVSKLLDPKLLNPELLWSLSMFYSSLDRAKRGLDWVMLSWLIPYHEQVPGWDDKFTAFCQVTETGLDKAIELGGELVGQLRVEIDALNDKMTKTK